MEIRNPYTRHRVITVIDGESMTETGHEALSDINNIVKRYKRTGLMPPGRGPGQYMDVSGLQMPLEERIAFTQKVAAKRMAEIEEAKAAHKAKAEAAQSQAGTTAEAPPS